MIELITTENGKNVIEMGDYGRLTFSDMTSTPEGYRWLTYSRKFVESIAMKASDGTRTYRHVDGRDSHVFNLQLKRDSEGKKGVPNGTMPRKLAAWLAIALGELSDGEVFPYKNIEKLKSKIAKTNFKKVLANKVPKKKKKRKRLTKKEKAAQEASLAILRGSLNDKKGNRS